MATAAGESRWISGDPSRAIVHALRGRVDAILVGRRTAELDDPLLTARPPGPRTPVRIVLDSQATLSVDSQLVRTARQVPLLVAASANALAANCSLLREHGVEVWQSSAGDQNARLTELLDELGRRQVTNLLVEGGAEVLGSLFDLNEIDEIHAFIAPRIVGGDGPSPIAGRGVAKMAAARSLRNLQVDQVGDDLYLSGRLS